MNKKYSFLSKNVLLFCLNGFVPKILNFILVPIYTGYLSTTEYGVSDIISTTVLLLVPIFTLDIQDAVLRFAMDDKYKNEEVFTVAMRIVICGTGILSVISLFVNLLNISWIEPYYLLFLVIMYFTTALQNSFSLFCRGVDKVKVVVVGSIIHSALTLSLNILFLVLFKWGLIGFLLANSIGAFLSLVYIFISGNLKSYMAITVNKIVFKDMWKYSFPLIFSVIAWWINNASDHYILTLISGVAASGVYAVAYKIPNLLSTFQNVFAQAWSISAIKEFDKDDKDGFIGNMYTLMNASMCMICSLLMILDVPIAKLLYAKDFFEAWKYVPPLLVSVVFNAMALFIGSIFTAVKDTKTLSYSTILGAVINTTCNFLFIPFWSTYGAAIATLLGYFSTFAIRHILLKKYILLKANWKRDISCYFLLITQMIMAFFGIKLIFLQVITSGLIFALYYKEIKKTVTSFKRIINKKVHKEQ